MKNNLKICMMFFMVVALTGSMVHAAGQTYSWKIPDNVRIVQPGTVDNVRTFASIQAALDSIGGASASNPFQIMVMPGVYSYEHVTLKRYVNIKGAGPDSTIIYADFYAYQTVNTLEDMTIIQNNGGSYVVLATEGAVVKINNCIIDNQSASGDRASIYVSANGTGEVRDSMLKTGIVAASIINGITPNPPSISLIRTTISGIAYFRDEAAVIGSEGSNIRIQDSTIDLSYINSQNPKKAIFLTSSNLVNTIRLELVAIEGVTYSTYMEGSLTDVAITGSKLIANFSPSATGFKIVNSFDNNYNLIANQ